MERNKRKVREGYVVSAKMERTCIVVIETLQKHQKYKKYIKKRKKVKVDNPENKAKEGDFVRIMEVRPLSKTKRWRIVEILRKA